MQDTPQRSPARPHILSGCTRPRALRGKNAELAGVAQTIGTETILPRLDRSGGVWGVVSLNQRAFMRPPLLSVDNVQKRLSSVLQIYQVFSVHRPLPPTMNFGAVEKVWEPQGTRQADTTQWWGSLGCDILPTSKNSTRRASAFLLWEGVSAFCLPVS